ncbi:2-oxoglutarate and iron-dependent oxygenase domain-containing protein [Streptomyces sp. VNUA116]|uniref:isopenicillin N synthase family dioxygenase n=1 Tax=Streptomyces sp. VNUA116 TaxID=3062449 RepID=UPI002676D8DB|nr:2-oxoglutarate and iron-dependent oxygenase domain-containing protein [Streptomyces sp. VNUA116]WKU42938.1 2-oxoglutarate and iron-dependent oxygenase domain-containing protein [Streptomyces sp. VNUA116]
MDTSTSTPDIPTIDLCTWRAGRPQARDRLAATVDRALQQSGFLLVTGHGIHRGLPEGIRAAARAFFQQPAEAKTPFLGEIGQYGWSGSEAVAAGRAEGAVTPPDLVETWSVGPCPHHTGAGHGHLLPASWPSRPGSSHFPPLPSLHCLVVDYTHRMRALPDELLQLLAAALRQPLDFFTRHTARPDWTLTLNWYPAITVTGAPEPGQFRVGPHTDFGTITILDRQQGKGGLQVHTEENGWQDAPYAPDALTVNIGDLMARWTGDRWRAGRHRVQAPPLDAAAEELTSLVYFYDCDPHTLVESLPAPIGRVSHPPVTARSYVRAKVAEIAVSC